MNKNVKIIATGSYIPNKVIPNSYFLNSEFYTPEGLKIDKPNQQIIEELMEITGIKERRYVDDHLLTSDIAYFAAKCALESSLIFPDTKSEKIAGVDKETIDAIIVAHNYGNVKHGTTKSDFVPSIAAIVKKKLGIKNVNCQTFDIISGCPGWIDGIMQAYDMIKSGRFKRILVIGAETLSRVSDPHDRDRMIFSDGSGAVIVEEDKISSLHEGILSYSHRTDADLCNVIYNSVSNNKGYKLDDSFIHMDGRNVWKYAISKVPEVVKDSLTKAKLHLNDITKIVIHQANEKMDYKIGENLCRLFGGKFRKEIMPMTIDWLGNTSVATIPTLLDLLLKGQIDGHTVSKGDNVVFASVGAGMRINSVVYRF